MQNKPMYSQQAVEAEPLLVPWDPPVYLSTSVPFASFLLQTASCCHHKECGKVVQTLGFGVKLSRLGFLFCHLIASRDCLGSQFPHTDNGGNSSTYILGLF